MSWQRTRLKYLAAVPIANGVGEPAEFDDPTWPRYIRTTDIAGPTALKYDTFVSLPPQKAVLAPVLRGDILMSAAGTIGRTYLHDSDDPACFAGYLVRFRPSRRVDPRFVSYWTQANPFLDQVNAGVVRSTIDNFNASKYQNLLIDVPGLASQRTIADFLDAETAQIDALVASRQRMIELLLERRSALIAHLMSGVPGTWTTPILTRLKFAVGRPTSGNRDHAFTNDESGVPCLRGLNIKPGWVDPSNLMRISQSDHLQHAATILRSGDLVIVRSGNAGTAAVVPPELDGANCVDLVIVRQAARVTAKFLEYFLNSPEARMQAEKSVFGATLAHFNAVDIGELSLFIPSVAEQEACVAVLDELTSQIDTARTAMHLQIDILLERRQAMITAAVTGQLDIPRVAA